MITDINPMAVRESESSQRVPMPATANVADTFSNVMANAAPAVGATVELNRDYRSGAVAAAAMTGLSGATQSMTGVGPGLSPLISTATPLGAGGYSYTGVPSSVPGVGYGYGATTSYLDPNAASGLTGVGSSVSNAANLGQVMANETLNNGMVMIGVQAAISNASTLTGVATNCMKVKSDSDHAIIQNMRT